jgi:hypothetical protein
MTLKEFVLIVVFEVALRIVLLIFITMMMYCTNSLSIMCGAYCSIVTNVIICTDCGYCFHLNCASTSPSAPDRSMLQYCIQCKYQKHVKQQERRIRHLEKELKAIREEICKLTAGKFSSNSMQQDNSGHLEKTKKKHSKCRCSRFSASQVQLNTYFIILTSDALEVGQ